MWTGIICIIHDVFTFHLKIIFISSTQMCANQGSLKSHIQNVHNPSGLKFKCEECNKVFFKFYYGTHFHFKRLFAFLSQPFSSNATLKMHIKRLHSGEKPLKCAYCEMVNYHHFLKCKITYS